IACPACATRYVVPDSAIGAEGRTVRCAKCRHSWFQEGPAQAPPETAPPAAAARSDTRDDRPEPDMPRPQAVAPAPPAIEDEPFEDEPPAPAFEEPELPPAEPGPPIEDAPSHFEHEPPFRPRRNTLKRLTYAGAVFAADGAGRVVGVRYYGPPARGR